MQISLQYNIAIYQESIKDFVDLIDFLFLLLSKKLIVGLFSRTISQMYMVWRFLDIGSQCCIFHQEAYNVIAPL